MLDLSIDILSPRSLRATEEGRELLRLWLALLPEYTPEYCGNTEPVKHPFNPRDLDGALAYWQCPFLATRRRPPRMQASVWMDIGPKRQHAAFGLSLRSEDTNPFALRKFLGAMTSHLRADFAEAHVLGPVDIERGQQAGSVEPLNKNRTRFMLMVSTRRLQRYLGDLYWATVFGPPYVDLIGRERLLSAPAHESAALEYGGVYVQVTRDMLDPKRRPAEFEETRQRVKTHLDNNIFFDPDAPATHVYQAPEFRFEPE